MTYKKDRNKAGIRKLKNTTYTVLQNDGGLLTGLQRNALTSLVHFARNKVLGMQVHCIGGQRGGRHCSVVGSALVSSFAWETVKSGPTSVVDDH